MQRHDRLADDFHFIGERLACVREQTRSAVLRFPYTTSSAVLFVIQRFLLPVVAWNSMK
jgi:hypothetical protein